MDIVGTVPFRPPVPPAPAAPLSNRGFLRSVRTNALTMFPEAAYHEDSTSRRILGGTTVVLNAPDAIHHVLVGNPGNFRRSPASIRVLRPITGEGLLLSEGDAWKLQRRTIAPALGPRVMPMLARHIVASADRAIAKLSSQTAEPVSLLASMQNLALDIAGRSMFSLEMDRYGATMRALMTEYGERYSRPHLLDMVLPPSIPNLRDLARYRFRWRWMKFIETILASRLAEPPAEAPRDLFDLLRAARDPETGAAFSPPQLRDQVATLILAGHETTAVTLFWAILMLAQAPEEQQWLAEETGTVTIEPETAHAAMSGLVRTRAVVNETLRLFPSAFTLVRETIKQDRAAGIDLPARSIVMIAPWVLHRHYKLWDDPAAFRPTRFMPDQPPPARFAFMPFGAGPRICVGAQFAMTEAVLVLAALIARFRVTRVDIRPILPVGIVTTQPDHPAYVRLAIRQ
ncbi:MAG TPA: cytochrome P450 [Rhodopila sp.]